MLKMCKNVQNDELVVDKSPLEREIKQLQIHLENNEQKNRNINLLIHRISETNGEKTDQ